MDGEYKGEKFPKWSMVRRSKQNIKEDKYLLEARYKKFLKGIQLLNQIKTKPVSIKNIDCINFDKYINEKADLIF